jgi:hypothetical protein
MKINHPSRLLKILCGMTISILPIYAAENPAPPDGFTWQLLKQIRARVPKPDGWHYKHARMNGGEGFFISRENIDKHGSFSTGLSINLHKGVRRKAGVPPSEYSAATLRGAKMKHGVEGETPIARGDLKGVSYRFNFTPKGHPKRTMQSMDLYDDEKDILLVLFFEAPSSEWDDAWKLGKVMMEKFTLEVSK